MIINLKSQPRIKFGANSKFQIYFAFFILIFAFCIITDAYAHKVNIYAYAENNMVHSESYFVDGTKCKNSVVEVFNEKGIKLLEGTTDENGNFSFKIPGATSLKLVLHASMGHQAEYTLSEDEVREAMRVESLESKVKSQESRVKSQESEKEVKKSRRLENEKASDLEAIVENAVDRKLQPLIRTLTELREKSERPGITEIIGGIGYIIGILGIIAYFKSRKVKKD